MALLNSETLKAKSEKRRAKVTLAGGDSVLIESMNALEMRLFKNSLNDDKGNVIRNRGDRWDLLLIANHAINEDGSKMFTEEQVLRGELDLLDGQIIAQLYDECQKFSGFYFDSDFKAIVEEVKNLAAISGDSSS